MSGLTAEQRIALTYLLPGERVVVFSRRHWTVIFEPLASAVAGLILLVAVSVTASSQLSSQASGRGMDLLWWIWFAVLGRALFKVWEWRRDHFVATDRRLLLIYGFIVRKVAMMPLKKVTDLSYHRSVWGRLLGYGTFVLESAGQDQALHELRRINRPDDTYRAIMAQIFVRPGDDQYGEAEVVTILPEDTTKVGSLARMQRLWPARSKRWWGPDRQNARERPGTKDSPGQWGSMDWAAEEHPVIRDGQGRPLLGGRSVYSSQDADRTPPPVWVDPDDD